MSALAAYIYISSLSTKFSCTFLRCLPSVESGRNARTASFYSLFHVVKFEAQGDVANWLEPNAHLGNPGGSLVGRGVRHIFFKKYFLFGHAASIVDRQVVDGLM
jgi:hypothetical protein